MTISVEPHSNSQQFCVKVLEYIDYCTQKPTVNHAPSWTRWVDSGSLRLPDNVSLIDASDVKGLMFSGNRAQDALHKEKQAANWAFLRQLLKTTVVTTVVASCLARRLTGWRMPYTGRYTAAIELGALVGTTFLGLNPLGAAALLLESVEVAASLSSLSTILVATSSFFVASLVSFALKKAANHLLKQGLERRDFDQMRWQWKALSYDLSNQFQTALEEGDNEALTQLGALAYRLKSGQEYLESMYAVPPEMAMVLVTCQRILNLHREIERHARDDQSPLIACDRLQHCHQCFEEKIGRVGKWQGRLNTIEATLQEKATRLQQLQVERGDNPSPSPEINQLQDVIAILRTKKARLEQVRATRDQAVTSYQEKFFRMIDLIEQDAPERLAAVGQQLADHFASRDECTQWMGIKQMLERVTHNPSSFTRPNIPGSSRLAQQMRTDYEQLGDSAPNEAQLTGWLAAVNRHIATIGRLQATTEAVAALQQHFEQFRLVPNLTQHEQVLGAFHILIERRDHPFSASISDQLTLLRDQFGNYEALQTTNLQTISEQIATIHRLSLQACENLEVREVRDSLFQLPDKVAQLGEYIRNDIEPHREDRNYPRECVNQGVPPSLLGKQKEIQGVLQTAQFLLGNDAWSAHDEVVAYRQRLVDGVEQQTEILEQLHNHADAWLTSLEQMRVNRTQFELAFLLTSWAQREHWVESDPELWQGWERLACRLGGLELGVEDPQRFRDDVFRQAGIPNTVAIRDARLTREGEQAMLREFQWQLTAAREPDRPYWYKLLIMDSYAYWKRHNWGIQPSTEPLSTDQEGDDQNPDGDWVLVTQEVDPTTEDRA